MSDLRPPWAPHFTQASLSVFTGMTRSSLVDFMPEFLGNLINTAIPVIVDPTPAF